MKGLVGAFNQEKAIVGAFSVITNLRIDLYPSAQLSVQSIHGGAGMTSPVVQARSAAQQKQEENV